MQRRAAQQLRLYPRTFLYAFLHPVRLQRPEEAGCWTRPLPFAALSYGIAWALAALLADESILGYYEWPPWIAPAAGPLARLPGFSFLCFATLTGLGMLGAFVLSYVSLWLTGRPVGLRQLGGVLGYFAGGPVVSVVALQSIGLPLTLGAVLTLPDWLRVGAPSALVLYLLYWLVRQLAALPQVGWWRAAVAAGVGAVVVGPAPVDPVAALALEPYAMTVDSMAPQVGTGSIAIANQAVLDWRGPAPGELVVFMHVVGGADVAVLRRVVGMPGETVRLQGGALTVDGAPAARRPVGEWRDGAGATGQVYQETLPDGPSYRVVELDAGSPGDGMAPVEVPAGHVFVLADNRDLALDSRQIGPVPIRALRGVVYYQLRPESRRLR